MKRKIKGMLAAMVRWGRKVAAAVLCHRAMHGLAAAAYGASAFGLAGKEAVAWVLCGAYAVIAARG